MFSPNTIIPKKTPKRKHGQAKNGGHATMRVWHVVPYPDGKGGMCYSDPDTGEQRPVLDGTFINVAPNSGNTIVGYYQLGRASVLPNRQF